MHLYFCPFQILGQLYIYIYICIDPQKRLVVDAHIGPSEPKSNRSFLSTRDGHCLGFRAFRPVLKDGRLPPPNLSMNKSSVESYLGVAQNLTGGVTRVLVHVSTYQGSILVPVF